MIQELVTIDKTVNSMEVFTKEKGLDPFLDKIREQIKAFVPDVETINGRKDIASFAHKVSRSKAYLDGVGKELVADLKLKPKLIDKERRRIRDILDGWKEEVRRPLNEWETRETDRLNKHKARLLDIRVIYESCVDGMSADLIKGLMDKLAAIEIGSSWEEFREQAEAQHHDASDALLKKFNSQVTYEKEQDELQKLRQEKVAREAKEREERLAKEAVEKEREDAAKKAIIVKEKARVREEELKMEAEKAEREKKEAIEKAEREKKEAALQVEKEKIEATELAEKRKQEAIEAEKIKIEQEKKRLENRARILQENLEHRKSVNRSVLALLLENGVDESIGRKIITLAAQGKLDNLIMKY